MLPVSPRRRVRPSSASVVLSAAVFVLAAYLLGVLLGQYSGFALLLAFIILAGVATYRYRGLGSSLPGPQGRGRESRVGPAQVWRTGLLMILGIVLVVAIPVVSTAFLPPLYFFSLLFGIVLGFPASEIVFFVLVLRLEKRLGGRLFTITEDAEEDGVEILIRTVVLERD